MPDWGQTLELNAGSIGAQVSFVQASEFTRDTAPAIWAFLIWYMSWLFARLNTVHCRVEALRRLNKLAVSRWNLSPKCPSPRCGQPTLIAQTGDQAVARSVATMPVVQRHFMEAASGSATIAHPANDR